MARVGSLQNLIADGSRDAVEKPKVGDPATIVHWTDRTAATVVEVSKSGKTIVVQQDIATRTDKNGMSDCQSYEFARNPNGPKIKARMRKNGHFRTKGRPGERVLVGVRSQYYDYSF